MLNYLAQEFSKERLIETAKMTGQLVALAFVLVSFPLLIMVGIAIDVYKKLTK